jgi:dTDP-4-dehydrorhamnose reductase
VALRKIVLLGGGGQLGVELAREFERRQWIVQRFDRASLDITDAHTVEAAISPAGPQVVVNAAAYNQVDIAESEPLAAYRRTLWASGTWRWLAGR